MRSSFIVASLFATLALAKPVHQKLHKKAIVYDIVTDVVTVTVTAGAAPIETVKKIETVYINQKASTTKSKSTTKKSTTKSRRPTSTTTSTTTTTPSPIPTTTSVAPPPPPPAPTTTTTTEEPAFTPEPEPVIEPEQKFENELQNVNQGQDEGQQSDPVTEPPPPSGDSLQDTFLSAHNQDRAKHHAGPLSWDGGLASDAQKLVSQCTGNHGVFGTYGQNIASGSGSSPSNLADVAASSCSMWYGEVQQFGGYYGQSDISDTSVLHFTQVVWKSSTKLGCACTNECPGNGWECACNYASPGNYAGQYAENVSAP